MAPPAQVESPAEERNREDGRGEDLHLGDDGEGGGVDVAEREEAEQVHDEVDHLVRIRVRARARVRVG